MIHRLRNLRPGRAPLGMLGALALILGVEGFVASHGLDTMDGAQLAYENARETARTKVKDRGILAFGDSLMKLGYAPKVVQDRTGLDGYNFAIPGAQAPTSYFLLREALASGARPKVVVVDFFPCLLSADPWPNIANLPIVASYQDCLEMAWHGRDPDLFAALMFRKLFPSAGRRESIRAAIAEALRGAGGFTRANNLVSLRSWEANRGLVIEAYRHDKIGDINGWVARFFRPIRCTLLNRLYIDRFMKLAAAHDVKVCLLLPPYMPAMQARLEQVGFDADHRALVRSLVREYPGMDVLDATRSDYHFMMFVDTHHLAYEGASTYSAEVGEFLRRAIDDPRATPRWASMPPYRRRPITVWHENLDESRIAVTQDIPKRRR